MMMRALRLLLVGFLLAFAGATQAAGPPFSASNYPFGVNISGPEYAPWAGQQFPTVANWDYLQSEGVKRVRLPIPLESVFPILGGPVDPTEIGLIQTALSRAYARGIGVLIDDHDFAHLCDQAHWVSSGCSYAGNSGQAGAGVSVLGDSTFTQAVFVDMWTKEVTALQSSPAIIGWGLMNEPGGVIGPQLLFAPNGFGDTFGSQPWFPTAGSVATQLAAGTNPLGSTYGTAWNIDSGSGFGAQAQNVTLAAVPYDLSVYAKVSAGTDTLNFGIVGTSTTKTVTTSWQRFDTSFTPSAGAQEVIIGINSAAGHNIQIADAMLVQGTSPPTYSGSNWLPFAQAAITAIRAIDQRPIYVAGTVFTACEWPWTSWDNLTLTGGNLVNEAHQYFAGSASSCGGTDYSQTFTSYGITVDQGLTEMAPFVNWTITTGASGYLGELNVVNNATDNNPQWLVLQNKVWNYLEPNRIPATIWFFNSGTLQPANNLGVAPQSGVDDPRLLTMLAVGQ